MKRKALSMVLAVAMVLSLLPATALAAYSDVQGHWGREAIEKWSDMEILQGFDGKFRPNDPITRGDMAVIVDRVMKYQTKAANTFTDLGQAYYTDAVLKASAAGVIQGNANRVRPNDRITREEAAVMLGRALGVREKDTASQRFADSAAISSWAAGYINAMADKGYVSGLNGRFNPKTSITRAEVVTILNNSVTALFTEAKEYTGDVSGIAIVNVPDAVLKDMEIKGDLIISEGVGSGDVTLENVTVLGNTIVRGGGADSIHIIGDSRISNIIVEKKDDGTIRVVTSDGTVVESVFIDDGRDDVILTGAFESVSVAAGVSVKAVGAQIKKVEVTSGDAEIDVDEDTEIDEITVASSAGGAGISVSGKVGTLTTDAKIKIENNGTITKAEVNADGVIIDGKKPATLEVADTVTDVPTNSDGGAVGSGNTSGGGGGGGGGNDGPTTTTISGVIPAPLVDQANTDTNVTPTDYAVRATKRSDQSYIRIAITATNLKAHKNAAESTGYWIGAAIEVPAALADTGSIKYTFGTAESAMADDNYGTPDVIGGKKYVVFYANAGETTPKTHITIDWDGAGAAYSPTKYLLDLSGATWSTVGNMSVDESGGPNNGKYTVSLSTNTVTVNISSLLSEYDAMSPEQGVGQWLGILIDTGVTLTNLEYKTAGPSFVELTEADIAEAQASGAGSADDTLVWWVKAEDGNGKTISLKYKGAPDKTAVKLTLAIPAAELAVSGIIAAPLVDQADMSPVELDLYEVDAKRSSAEAFTNIAITATDVPEHKNAVLADGYWVGAAIEVPAALTDTDSITYSFGTAESDEANEPYGPPDVIGGKNYVVFYANAGDETPKTYITIDWDGDGADYSPAKYRLDLIGVTWSQFEASAAPATAGENAGKYSVSLTDGTIDVAVVEDALIEYESPVKGDGKWLGILINTGIELTDLEYKTTGPSFTALTTDDIAEAQASGAGETDVDTLVWWIKEEDALDDEHPKTISLKCAGTPDRSALTFTVEISDIEPESFDTDHMEADTVKVGGGYVAISEGEETAEVSIALPMVSEANGYGVNAGRLNLDGDDFNYTDATGEDGNGWDNPQIAYVPVLISLGSGSLEGLHAKDIWYNGESGDIIPYEGNLYANIPVASNSNSTPSDAEVGDWSLLSSDVTEVIVRATSGENGSGEQHYFKFTAYTYVQLLEGDMSVDMAETPAKVLRSGRQSRCPPYRKKSDTVWPKAG